MSSVAFMAVPHSRIGMDPVNRVVVMENHDEAYHAWKAMGVRDRILVHVDAHHDMWWTEDGHTMTIANFLCPALKEGFLRELYWVVPDATFSTRPQRRAFYRHIENLVKDYPKPHHPLRESDELLSTVVLGKPLRVCTLNSLPQIAEPVLLDIDCDFMAIPRVPCGSGGESAGLPWCWPRELLAQLQTHGLITDLATISYSVEGGFTPLRWKYLGDELALRLRGHAATGPALRGMDLIREGAQAAFRGDVSSAEAKYREASRWLPTHPAPWYHLALLQAELGAIEEGQRCYRQAIALDPSYRTPYNNPGPWYASAKRYREAEKEYRTILALDPEDAYAYFGLGCLAAEQKDWTQAEELTRKALSLDGRLTDAYRLLGDILLRRGQRDEAIAAYERSLKSALAGHKPLYEPIATLARAGLVLDPDHGRTHARLARLYAAKGAVSEAITGYRMAIASHYDRASLRASLAILCLKRHHWRAFAQESWRGVALLLAGLRGTAHRWLKRCREGLRLTRRP